ncbi:hypothetical protein ACSBR1_009795 [Camellia fascicularis]
MLLDSGALVCASTRGYGLKLFLLRANAAVLISPATEQVKNVVMSICFFNLTIYFLKSCA